MKKLLFLLSLFILFTFACEKTDKDYNNEHPPYICHPLKFQVNINSTLIPHSSFFFGPDMYILGEDQGVTKVLKLDSAGNLLWTKSFPNIPGTPASIIVGVNGEPVFVTKEADVKIPLSTTSVSNVWVQYGYTGYSNCQPFYELGSSDSSYTIKSKTHIVRLHVDGSIRWSKSLDYSFGGNNCLRHLVNDEIVVITMKIQGRVPEFVYDANGVFQDTINYPMDSNIVYITNYKSDGAQVWQIAVPNVFNNSYSEVSPSLSFGWQQKYYIKSAKNLIKLSTNGYVESRESFDSQHCNQSATSMIKEHLISLFSGWYKEIDTLTGLPQTFNYVKRTDYGKTWSISSKDLLVDYGDRRFVTLSEDSTQINVYDFLGSLKWSYNCSKYVACGFNFVDGLFIAEQKGGKLQVTNTDINGNY